MKTITIIGAGLGGLTAGALLSKQGFNVTILEQHNFVGGCATTFNRRGGYTCEVGLHEMDSAFDDSTKKAIFDALGVYDHIEFVKSDEFFRLVTNHIDFVMPEGKEEAIKALTLAYPEEKEAIQKYFSLIKSVSDEFIKLVDAKWWQYLLFPFIFKNVLRYRTSSVKDVMDKLFKNEDIKLILNANVGYYSDKIKNCSFLFHSIAQNSYFTGGSWFIKGGSQKLSDYLASVVVENGGQVLVRSDVVKIENNSVTYKQKKKTFTLASDIVISNLSPSSTYQLAGIPYEEKMKTSSSMLNIYIGFKNNLKTVYGKRAYSNFIFNDVDTIDEYDGMVEKDICKRGFIFVDYSQVDSNLTLDKSKSFGVISTTDYLSNWGDLSEKEYHEKKDEILESFLNQLEKEYENIREHIEFAEIASPSTMQRYIKTPNATAYGFAPTPQQFLRTPQIRSKKMKNLYFVGAWVLGGGFSPAIYSGGLCANEIAKTGS
ncbi:MAG: NAD(P)/FAD-dependent oxidoreductase [Sulfurovum sp.]|nr:MAG: NAD(P)/FAD-dependent oxidoreductase [Sulfurovum sp.]